MDKDQKDKPTSALASLSAPVASDQAVCSTTVVKLPPFWKEHPIIWFAQVEAAFELHRISNDTTKFRYLLLNLDNSALPFVTDIITTPPAHDKYTALKDRLVQTFSETNDAKLRRLLTGTEFVDEKPSNFLYRLRNLGGTQCNDAVLRAIFMEKLPEQVRSILAISEVADLNKLAQQADQIVEMSRPHILAVSGISPSNNPAASLGTSKEADTDGTTIDALVRDVEYLKRSTRDSSQQRQRTDSRNRAHTNNTVCYYHKKFGAKARKCRAPCTFVQPNLN